MHALWRMSNHSADMSAKLKCSEINHVYTQNQSNRHMDVFCTLMIYETQGCTAVATSQSTRPQLGARIKCNDPSEHSVRCNDERFAMDKFVWFSSENVTRNLELVDMSDLESFRWSVRGVRSIYYNLIRIKRRVIPICIGFWLITSILSGWSVFQYSCWRYTGNMQ